MTDSSVYGQPLAERRPLYRRVWFWVVSAMVALPMLAFGGLVLWLALADEPLGPDSEAIDCAEATRPAGFENLPEGVEPVCAEGGFQDPFVTIDFAAPRDDVDAWLAAELPGTELSKALCVNVGSDECVQIGYGEPNAPENGWTLEVGTTDQGDGSVAVTVMAFSV